MRQAGYIVRMMTPFSPQLLKPDVELEHNPLRLVSRDFGDIYFSVEDGLAETDLVFIDGNDLISRMKTSKHLVVAETGFGTGLNFLALLRHWKRLGEDAPHLHFISTEIAPLPNDLIRTVLSAIPEIAEDVEMLVKALPPHWPGRHRRHFFDGKVTLDLYYGDSVTMLSRSQFMADAWFLDGFAPAKNPEMWQRALFTEIANHSHDATTLASFTAAGDVRRGLSEAGFEVERVEGFGHKRHRIVGKMITQKSGKRLRPQPAVTAEDRVVILGAGVAGAAVAAGLRRGGINPVIIGKGDGPHDGASGNIAAVQSPRMTATDSFSGQLSMTAYGYARWISRMHGASLSEKAVIYGWNEREQIRQEKILAQGLPESFLRRGDAEAMAEVTGCAEGGEGLIFDEGGAVDPRALTMGLMGEAETMFGVTVERIINEGGSWQLICDDGAIITADHLVLAGGAGLDALTKGFLDPLLPFQVTAGRVSHLPPQDRAFPAAMSFGGYLAKASDGRIALGATFDKNINDKLDINNAMHEDNYRLLPPALRGIVLPPNEDGADKWEGRLSYRLASKDRQPVAGVIDDGLSIITALGARGMVTGPILGEYVASLILGRPSPLDLGMAAVVDPFRFNP